MQLGRRGGSIVASQTVVPHAVSGSNPASPQPTSDCQSPGGLPPGMALGCGLTSVRGNRGENYEKGTAGSPKTNKEFYLCNANDFVAPS